MLISWIVNFSVSLHGVNPPSLANGDTDISEKSKNQKAVCFDRKRTSRDVVLMKKVWERTKNLANLKQLQTHFKTKLEKGVGTQFHRVPAPLHPSA